MKKLFPLLILTLLAMTSCKEETCDVSFSNMTFHFSVAPDADGALNVSKLQLYMKDMVSERTTGPINFSREAIEAATQGIVPENGRYNFSLTQRVPRGEYKVWIWGNIEDESVYSFDRYSISMKDNVSGYDYLLFPATEMTISNRNSQTDIDLRRVTGRVDIDMQGTGYQVVTLYISGLARKLTAEMEYSNAGTVGFEADRFENMPPRTIYLFPSMTGENTGADADPSQFALSYQKDNSTYSLTDELTVTAASSQTATFIVP